MCSLEEAMNDELVRFSSVIGWTLVLLVPHLPNSQHKDTQESSRSSKLQLLRNFHAPKY
jgi:hypothetical protein